MSNQYPDKWTEESLLALPGDGAVVREWSETFIDPAIRLLERFAYVLGERTFNSVDFPYLSQWMRNRSGPIADQVFEAFPEVQDEYLSVSEKLRELPAKFRALQADVLSSPELARGLKTVLLLKAPKAATGTGGIDLSKRTILQELFDGIRQGDKATYNSVSQRLCQHLIGTRYGRATGNEGFIDTQIVPSLLPEFQGRRDIVSNAADLRSAVEESQQTCNDFRLYLEEFRHHLCLRHPTFCDDE